MISRNLQSSNHRKNANAIALCSDDSYHQFDMSQCIRYAHTICNLITGVGDAKNESINIRTKET